MTCILHFSFFFFFFVQGGREHCAVRRARSGQSGCSICPDPRVPDVIHRRPAAVAMSSGCRLSSLREMLFLVGRDYCLFFVVRQPFLLPSICQSWEDRFLGSELIKRSATWRHCGVNTRHAKAASESPRPDEDAFVMSKVVVVAAPLSVIGRCPLASHARA